MNKIDSNIDIINSLAELDGILSDIIYMEIDKLKVSLENASSIEELLTINLSIKNMLQTLSDIERISTYKLSSAVNSSKDEALNKI